MPIPIPKLYTYQVPEDLREILEPGHLVLAQFGKRKIYTAIVHTLTEEAPDYMVKPLLGLEEEFPVLSQGQLEFWEWIASYYMCSLGEVFNAALPAAFRLQSESNLVLNTARKIPDDRLNEKTELLFEALENQRSLSVDEAGLILELKNPMPVIREFIKEDYILIEETLKEKIRPKMRKYVRLKPEAETEDARLLFDRLSASPKQADILMSYFSLKKDESEGFVEVKELLNTSRASATSLKGLFDKNILEQFEVEGQLTSGQGQEFTVPKELSEAQQKAFDDTYQAMNKGKTVLMHGVTSSGKTEIYIRLIANALENGENALYLLPEIALTTQLLKRLEFHFKERMKVYHSKLNHRERLEVWNGVLHPKGNYVVIGARSAALLPFVNLGLVVVDEEHEGAFKQHDPAPRYNGRDAALVLSKMHEAHSVLGSATPSLESYYNTVSGKYQLVELKERHGGVQLPEIEVVDIKESHRKKTMVHQFSPRLTEEIESCLSRKKKVILFQNRRGFAPVQKCLTCGHTPQCKHCDITLTYHKYSNQLRCHYCGYSISPPVRCTACGSGELMYLGFGTEQVEESLKELFPQARVARMDLDSTRRKNAFRELVDEFESGRIDILIGTQMVAKGLDFEEVMLVGILSADSLLNFPDFRAHERAFQLMVQVSGRAGRRGERGKVLIQTFDPYHEVIKWVGTNDYESLSKHELYERKQFRYPPLYRLIRITMRHKNSQLLAESSIAFARALRQKLGDSVLGPENPPVTRIKGLYQKQIILKLSKDINSKLVKDFIVNQADRVYLQKKYAAVRVIYDVDPN